MTRNCFGIPDKINGWTVSQSPDDYFYATGPNYDASYEGPEDGCVSNGEQVSARNWEDLADEIAAYLEEAGK